MFSRGFVEILAAMQTDENTDWYQGTADAVRQNLRYVLDEECEETLILSGDQLYRMDFRGLIQTHRDSKADVTIACIPVHEEQTSGFGLMKVDDTGKVRGFVEKPKTQAERQPYHTPASWIEERHIPCNNRHYLANMGIYLFNTEFLIQVLTEPPLATDFGKEVFPRIYQTNHVHAHLFDGYWEDLGTIRSYHESSLMIGRINPPFDFYRPEGVIYTRMRNLPASKFEGATLTECLVSDGCRIGEGSTLKNCLIGVRSRIGRHCKLTETVMIGSDTFETEAQIQSNAHSHIPNFNVGDGCIIERAILDKDCRVGNGVRIRSAEGKPDHDDPQGRFYIRDGIVCVPRGAIIPDGTLV
jgi:glucose-1-phosphate adenylyltransferase